MVIAASELLVELVGETNFMSWGENIFFCVNFHRNLGLSSEIANKEIFFARSYNISPQNNSMKKQRPGHVLLLSTAQSTPLRCARFTPGTAPCPAWPHAPKPFELGRAKES